MNDKNIGYKIWDWFNANKEKEVFVFEAIFDAVSSNLKNVILKKLFKFKNSITFEISAEFYPILMYNMSKSDKN